MRGGWHGSMGTVGGLTRTYGLQAHFTKGGPEGPPPQVTRAALRRIGGYFTPYWRRWAVVLGCVAAAAGLNVLPPFCVARIVDQAIPHANGVLLAVLAAAMVGLALASGLIGVAQQSLTARIGQSIMHDLRGELFGRLQRMSLGFYTATRGGEILSRINNDVNAVQGLAAGTVVTIAANAATLTATAVALLSMNWRLTLLAVMVVPAFYLPSKIIGSVRRRLAAQTQQSYASLLAFLSERLHAGGVLLTSIFGRRQSDAAVFADGSAAVRDLNVRQAVVGRWLFMILSVFSAVGPALIYWYGGWQVIRGELTTGKLIAFAALLTLLYRPLVQMASVYVDIQASVGVFERIFECLDLADDVPAAPRATPLARVAGHVRFENVHFTYPRRVWLLAGRADAGADEDGPAPFALRSVSFEVSPGQRVALVGPSGAGKTTVTYLLPRFYDPDGGRITLDGHDLTTLDVESLRKHIGIVAQETFLFHTTVRENLLYARGDAGEADMIDACRAASIHEFIAALPDGYDTVVGERGFRLSGGEKQRLSIARALLKDPAILILDEATSNLDATSEHLIQQAMEKLLHGRTSLIIAHRLSTILGCDRIVVMNAGQVVEVGRHEELLAGRGLYASLFEQQFGKVLDASAARRGG